MALAIDVAASRVVIETRARGMLAAVAHDLRIEAPIAEGSSEDGETFRARFDVARMKVVESSRHGANAWHAPSASDAADIEHRIRSELFEGCDHIDVDGKLEGDRATLTVRARGSETIALDVRIDRSQGVHASGKCSLSLGALHTGKVHVPLGAIKLDDTVAVTFDVSFV